MNQTFYLIDNNALLYLGRQRKSSRFFREKCYLTEDVAHEAGTTPDAATEQVVAVTPRILELLREVMSTIEPEETDLVDLYQNKGTADPVMVATALALTEENTAVLFPDTWSIVTYDKALLRVAGEHQLGTTTPDKLAEFIDQST